MKLSTDKAYLLGLIVGGGSINDGYLEVNISQKKLDTDSARAIKVFGDFTKHLRPKFRSAYGIEVNFEQQPIRLGLQIAGGLSADLAELGYTSGEIRKEGSLKRLESIIGDAFLPYLLAGLADATASLAPSHRRFSDSVSIASFEWSGFNYDNVAALARMLLRIKCPPDQILWNHPNQHSSLDRYNHNWKKGSKIRVRLPRLVANVGFRLPANVVAAKERSADDAEAAMEKEGGRRLSAAKPSCRHIDEDYELLPQVIRGLHFVHNQQLAEVYGCAYADREKILRVVQESAGLVSPFTIVTKRTKKQIDKIIASEGILAERAYKNISLSRPELVRLLDQASILPKQLMYSAYSEGGYPIGEIAEAIGYVICMTHVPQQVSVTRLKPGWRTALAGVIDDNDKLRVTIKLPDLLTPLVVEYGEYAVMIGPRNPVLYKNLLEWQGDMKFRMKNVTADIMRRTI
jgi:hypothetical protein